MVTAVNGFLGVGDVRHGCRMRFFTSDTHYGHQNIIRFCDRPYASVDHMNVDLVNRAATLFEVGDELWHLGDVALGTLDHTLAHLARIAVEVTLVAGNHDRCHLYNGKRGDRFVEVYRERCQLAGLVLTNTSLTLSNGVEVQVSHFPYPDPKRPAVGGSVMNKLRIGVADDWHSSLSNRGSSCMATTTSNARPGSSISSMQRTWCLSTVMAPRTATC